jgi:hypothetical protein
MIFSGSVDAYAIAECRDLGCLGSSIVASTINAFSQSFILVEVRGTSWSFGRIIEELELFSDWHMKNRMKANLKKMRIEDRVKALQASQTDLTTGDVSSHVIALLLDRVNQVLCQKSDKDRQPKNCILLEYPSSRFEDQRNSLAIKGIYKSAGQCTAQSFLGEMLAELLKWTDTLHIIDYSIGENWMDVEGNLSYNYPPALAEWCNYLVSLNRIVHVTLHTSGGHRSMIQEKVNYLTSGSQVEFSVVKHERNRVPHHRFVYALGFLIDIDPGIDLFKDGRVRDISAKLGYDEKARLLI